MKCSIDSIKGTKHHCLDCGAQATFRILEEEEEEYSFGQKWTKSYYFCEKHLPSQEEPTIYRKKSDQ